MSTRTRPGIPILDAERLAAVLGDAIDGLESYQVPNPNAAIEEIAHAIRYVRRELIRLIPEGVDHGQAVEK